MWNGKKKAVTFSFDVYGIEIVKKVNVAGTTLATPTYFKEANEVSIPLDAATHTVFARDNGKCFKYESCRDEQGLYGRSSHH